MLPPQWPNLNNPPTPVHVLVHSRSQEDYLSSTADLSTTIKTKFSTSTYSDLDAFIATLPKERFSTLRTAYFLVLDEQSVKDRKVTIIDKDVEWVDADGEVYEGVPTGRDDNLRKRRVWRRYRVPFEETFNVWVLLDVMPGMVGEEFLEEIIRE